MKYERRETETRRRQMIGKEESGTVEERKVQTTEKERFKN